MLSYVEASGAYVGPSLASWVQVGGSWTHLGSKLEVCAAILRPCRGILVVSGVQVGGQKFEDRVPGGSAWVFGLHRGGWGGTILIPYYRISDIRYQCPTSHSLVPPQGGLADKDPKKIQKAVTVYIYIYRYASMYMYA